MKKLFAAALSILTILCLSACSVSSDTPDKNVPAAPQYAEYDSGNAIDWLHDLGLTEDDLILPEFTRFSMSMDGDHISGINIYSSSAQSPDTVKAWAQGIMGKLVSASDDGILYGTDGKPLVTDDIDYGGGNVSISGSCTINGKAADFALVYTGEADTGENDASPTASFSVPGLN